MDIFDRLKAAAAPDWESYVAHDFVRQMGRDAAARRVPDLSGAGLPVPDQFARAYALAIYKSRSLADMRAAKAGLSAILDVEMDLHVRLCARWGLGPEELEAAPERAATVAYTRFVLDCGMAGDLLDLHVALAPCVVGYAEIGRALTPVDPARLAEHPYREWIGEYAGPAYQEVAAAARTHLDDLAARAMTERRFGELAALFAKASRLEADFWSMAFDET